MALSLNPLNWFGKDQESQTLERKEPEFGIDFLRYTKRHAGVQVNTSSAMELDTVYTCIRDKAESIGQLPVNIKVNNKKLQGGRLHKIFTQSPNDFMTMQDLVENYVTCVESYGRWFAYVNRNKYGNVSEIVPFRYQRNVSVQMDAAGRIYYLYATNDGKPGMTFSNKEIVHIKLNTLDGFTGLSPISQAAQAIGIAISQENYLSSLMADGAMPQGILYTDQIFKDDNAINRLKEEWSGYQGAENSGKTPILENNLKYQSMSLSPGDTELIKQRTFSRIQICGIFREPPHRVGIIDQTVYKTVEDNNTAYMRDALVPLIIKFENAMLPLLPEGNKMEFDESGCIRGDRKSQVEAVTNEFKMGAISINEMRTDLNRDEIDGGDVHAIDTNNLTFGLITDIPKLQEEQRQQQQSQPSGEVDDA